MLNMSIASNPLNWIKVGLMALLFFMALNIILTSVGGK